MARGSAFCGINHSSVFSPADRAKIPSGWLPRACAPSAQGGGGALDPHESPRVASNGEPVLPGRPPGLDQEPILALAPESLAQAEHDPWHVLRRYRPAPLVDAERGRDLRHGLPGSSSTFPPAPAMMVSSKASCGRSRSGRRPFTFTSAEPSAWLLIF